MTGKTHMLIGTVASLYFLPKLGYDPSITTSVAAITGSLIPDIDHPKAMINQKILPIKNKFGKMAFYGGIGAFLISQYGVDHPVIFSVAILLILIGFSQHRSFTHSFVGVFFICSTVSLALKNTIPYEILLAFIIGVISHLLADFTTVAGIELFYPFSKKKYRFIFTLSSSKFSESFICIFLIFFIVNYYADNFYMDSLLNLLNLNH